MLGTASSKHITRNLTGVATEDDNRVTKAVSLNVCRRFYKFRLELTTPSHPRHKGTAWGSPAEPVTAVRGLEGCVKTATAYTVGLNLSSKSSHVQARPG